MLRWIIRLFWFCCVYDSSLHKSYIASTFSINERLVNMPNISTHSNLQRYILVFLCLPEFLSSQHPISNNLILILTSVKFILTLTSTFPKHPKHYVDREVHNLQNTLAFSWHCVEKGWLNHALKIRYDRLCLRLGINP